MPDPVNFFLQLSRLLITLLLLAPTTLYGAAKQDAKPDPTALRTDGRLEFFCPDRPEETSIRIEIAETPAARATGLMGRTLQSDAEGLLFIFETARIRTFWMRNTPGSLDMIFVAEDDRVLNIAERTTAMSDQTYSSAGPARYVVEVRGGFAGRYGIDTACRIHWQRY